MRTVAFIPVRGGSKSIPGKNIKLLCCKPLIYWTVLSAQNKSSVDEVVIATDSDEIADVVRSFCFDKVVIYYRKKENALDNSSTESVILEYLEVSNLSGEDIFVLIQIRLMKKYCHFL